LLRPGNKFHHGAKHGELTQYMSHYWRQDPGAPAREVTVRGGAEKRIEYMKAKKKFSMAQLS